MLTPRFNLEGFNHLLFTYDPRDDIAFLHVDGPQPAVTTEVDDAWYIRIREGEIVGMELHGLKRIFMSTPFFSKVFEPSMRELEEFTGKRFYDDDDDEITAEGTIDQLPKTTHLLILMIGQAIAKFEALRKAEVADAGRAFFAEERQETLAT